jgi:hypothetical protein
LSQQSEAVKAGRTPIEVVRIRIAKTGWQAIEG